MPYKFALNQSTKCRSINLTKALETVTSRVLERKGLFSSRTCLSSNCRVVSKADGPSRSTHSCGGYRYEVIWLQRADHNFSNRKCMTYSAPQSFPHNSMRSIKRKYQNTLCFIDGIKRSSVSTSKIHAKNPGKIQISVDLKDTIKVTQWLWSSSSEDDTHA